jgi:ribosomal protein L32
MVVRMRHTRGQTGSRRSHHALSNPGISVDPKTGVAHLRHRASTVTGTYRGRQVIDIQKKLDKKTKKIQGKETK